MPDAASSETIAAESRLVLLETGLEAARTARGAGDLLGVLAACTMLRDMFPDAAEPFRLAAEVLTEYHRFDEADLLLEAAVERCPADAPLAAAFARAALHRSDLPACLQRWERVRAAFPDDLSFAAGQAVALGEAVPHRQPSDRAAVRIPRAAPAGADRRSVARPDRQGAAGSGVPDARQPRSGYRGGAGSPADRRTDGADLARCGCPAPLAFPCLELSGVHSEIH